MALDVILHKARQAQAGQRAQPEKRVPEAEAVFLDRTHTVQREKGRGHHGADDLFQAHKAVAAQEQGVVAGAVEYDLRQAVGQHEQGEHPPAAPALPRRDAPEAQHEAERQEQEQQGAPGALEAEGGGAPLDRAGGGVDGGGGPGEVLPRLGQEKFGPVGGAEVVAEPPHRDAQGPGGGDGVQQPRQVPRQAERPHQQAGQDDPGEHAHQAVTPACEIRHRRQKAGVALKAAVPVDGAGGVEPGDDGQRHRNQQRRQALALQQPRPDGGQQRAADGAGQDDRAPVDKLSV